MFDDLTDCLLPEQLVFSCVGRRQFVNRLIRRWWGGGRRGGDVPGPGKGRLPAHYDSVTAGDTTCYGDDLL